MAKNTEISDRISKIIEHYGINNNIFAKKLGYTRSQTVYDIINMKSAPSYDFFKKFVNSEFSDTVNVEWLLAGKGEMIKESKEDAESKASAIYQLIDQYYNIVMEHNRKLEHEVEEFKKNQQNNTVCEDSNGNVLYGESAIPADLAADKSDEYISKLEQSKSAL